MYTQQNDNNEQINNSITIQEFYLICKSHWKLFVGSIIISLAIAFLYLSVVQPIYTRTATILVKDNDRDKSINGLSLSEMGLTSGSINLNNELIIFRSLTMMQNVVKHLNLTTQYEETKALRKNVLYGKNLPVNVMITGIPEELSIQFEMKINDDKNVTLSKFVRGKDKISSDPITCQFDQAITTPIGKLVVTKTETFEPERTITVYRKGLYRTTNEFMKKLSVVRHDKISTVVDLTMNDYSNERADDVLNSLISIYNENWLNDKNRVAINTAKFIDNRLKSLKFELDSVDQAISSFKSENLIPDIEAASNIYMHKSDRADAELMALNNRLYMCNYILDYIKQNPDELMPATTGMDNSTIESLISEFNTKMMRRNRWVLNSSERNPLVKDIDQELNSVRNSIVESIKTQILTLNTQIQNINKENSQNTTKIAASPNQAAYLISVERLQKVKESLYFYLLQKLEETQLNQVFSAYNTNVITSPHGTRIPTSPRRMIFIFMALVFGVGAPIVFLYLKETLNTKVRNREDLKHLSIPIIGEIPTHTEKRGLKLINKNSDNYEIVVEQTNRNVINEAFRVLRTNVDFMMTKNSSANVLIFTSFNPGSGKSFISMNMAVSLAIKGKKILVIDGDLRRGSLSGYVGSPQKGISNYLAQQTDDISKLIIPMEGHEKLHILPVGTIPPNPTELIETQRFKELINSLRDKYEYIIIDCPPINIVADTQIIEMVADRTMFIIRAGLMDRNLLPELERIYRNNVYKNMSIIMNATTSNERYGYGYYKN